MEKINFRNIYERTRRMLTRPETEWGVVSDEFCCLKDVFRNYLLPVTVISSLLIFLFGFFHYTVMQTVGHSIINLLASISGVWLAYLITREYLSNKHRDADNIALNLTVYSGVIFVVFHSLGVAFGNYFLGQLFTLLSFIFIRTLYIGIRQLTDLQGSQQTNLLVITALSIICIPVIIAQVLMIVFGISAFNV